MAQPFAALNAADGTVISHRHQEWLKFLRLIDDATPAEKELHLIADNYATSTPRCSDGWHGILGSHFTPTSRSWLNMVERFFRDLIDKRLRRGVFRDVEALIMAILDWTTTTGSRSPSSGRPSGRYPREREACPQGLE